ncbi:MAG: type II toxin-antitoxin system VapC family toxin [Myxococcaceae bacterium]
MKSAVFVDTGAFYALQVQGDRWHEAALRAFQTLMASSIRLFTSNLVVGETFTLLLIRHGRHAAWSFHDAVVRSKSIEIIHVSDEVENLAWTLLRRYADQPFSFVDGASFALMRQKKITRALAFDSHFAAAGFIRVPVDEPA